VISPEFINHEAPPGAPAGLAGIRHMIRMQDGRGIEHWAVRDDGGLMRQLTA